MKLLFVLLGFGGLIIVLGGLGAVAEDTYPQAVPLASAAANTGATAGDPTLLILAVIAVIGGLALGIGKGR